MKIKIKILMMKKIKN